MRCIFTNRTIGIGCFSIGTNRNIGTNGPLELPCTQVTWENNQSPPNEMHINSPTEPLEWRPFLLVPILPLVPMDHRFDESYPFVYIGHVWAIDHHAPLKRVNLKSNRLPWINPAIKKQMLIRNLLYKKFRRIPTNENWNRYRCQRNKVTALKKQSVKDFCFDASSVFF